MITLTWKDPDRKPLAAPTKRDLVKLMKLALERRALLEMDVTSRPFKPGKWAVYVKGDWVGYSDAEL